MILLEHITMAGFKKYLKQTRTIVFPFGTIEEHGPHLPLHTDTFIIVEVLRRVAQKEKFFLAPPVYYGVCTATGGYPGTIAITSETLRRLTMDLVSDAYRKGLRNFMLISGHGGSQHMSALKEAAEILVNQLDGIRIAAFSPYDLLWKHVAEMAETPNDAHAGEVETSIMLYLAPELVCGTAPEEYPQMPKPFIVRDKMKYWKGGVWGNPQKATVEKGAKAVRLMVDAIAEVIGNIRNIPGSR